MSFVFCSHLVAQEKCMFYINDGKKAVDKVSYSNMDNLKFEVSYPKKCADFDKISLDLYASWDKSSPYSLATFIKSQKAEIAGKKNMYWMFNPAVADEGGDFANLTKKVYLQNVNTNRYKEVEFELVVKGCMEIGTEQWYDEGSGTWQTRIKYGNCETLSSGKVLIESVFETFFTDPDEIVKVNYVNPNITFPKFEEYKSGVMPYKSLSIRMTENMESDGTSVGVSTFLNLYIINIKSVENLEKFKTAKAASPDYQPYQFVKDEIENYFKLNTFSCNPFGEEKRNKWQPSYNWVQNFTNCNGNFIPELDKFEIANPIVGSKKGISSLIWKKKTIGKYEYDNVHYDIAYWSKCMAGQMELNKKVVNPIDFTMIYRNPYIIIVVDEYWTHNANEVNRFNFKNIKKCTIVDEQKQKGYIQTLLNNLEFLK